MTDTKQTYRYYFTVTHGKPHLRFHTDKRCLFAAKLLGMDSLRETDSSLDDDRCTACGGLLREKVKRGKA